MKIKVKDVRPNPYRNIDHYPLNSTKVAALKKSIEKTGFWDNLVGRILNGEVQIAYGHHRIEALKLANGYGDDFEFDLPIKQIDNRTMIQIMANENMQEWEHSTTVIDETVKVAKKFLENEDLFLSTKNKSKGRNDYKTQASGKEIADFLGWGSDKVSNSLKRLKAIDDGKLSKEAIEILPTELHVNTFTTIVVRHHIDPILQVRLATIIKDGKKFSGDIFSLIQREAIGTEIPREKDRLRISNIKRAKVMFKHYYSTAQFQAQELKKLIDELSTFSDELLEIPKRGELDLHILILEFESLSDSIENIIEKLNKTEPKDGDVTLN